MAAGPSAESTTSGPTPSGATGPSDGPTPEDARSTSSAAGEGAPEGGADAEEPAGKPARKGSFWKELPLLILVAVVLTFVIQTFVARIYVIPSASMEKTLHGCTGCNNDRVAVDKVTYRFTGPAPGDVVVFAGPAAWRENDEVTAKQPSSNALVRGFEDTLAMFGIGQSTEKDFVKRVIATGGQTVACCDAQNHVTVDGKALNEPYIYLQDGTPATQAPFDPVVVPAGQLWVMGDNRNNSADSRFHGPIGVTDIIGKARAIVLPVDRWGGVAAQDPQTTTSALGAPGWTSAAPAAAGLLLATPVVGYRRYRRDRRALLAATAVAAGGPGGTGDDDALAEDDSGGDGDE